MWAARGSSARNANIEPHTRPGIYRGLEGYESLDAPLRLDAIRERAGELRAMLAALREAVGDPLYFPFELGQKRPIRPMQGYLFKLPKAFVGMFSLDGKAPDLTAPVGQHEPSVGQIYRPADEVTTISQVDPFAVDPSVVERGVRGHAETQNRPAEHIKSLGLKPLSPGNGDPNFDLAWHVDNTVFVTEVKSSLTHANEEKQLRLALGQVLRYAHQLRLASAVKPVIAVERDHLTPPGTNSAMN